MAHDESSGRRRDSCQDVQICTHEQEVVTRGFHSDSGVRRKQEKRREEIPCPPQRSKLSNTTPLRSSGVRIVSPIIVHDNSSKPAGGHFSQVLTDFSLQLTPWDALCAESARSYPVISIESLKELDADSIDSNVHLRHDQNFDRVLYFRPNDGTWGATVRNEENKKYWHAVALDLKYFAFLLRHPDVRPYKFSKEWQCLFRTRSKDTRLRKVIESLKYLMRSLTNIPGQQAEIGKILDESSLLKLLQRDDLNFPGLMEFIAQILKTSCAPMRDNQIDQWLESANGAWNSFGEESGPAKVVTSLEELFKIIELMRLDIANYILRSQRESYIHTTIMFERAYFRSQMKEKCFDSESGRSWYDQVCRRRRLAAFTDADENSSRHSFLDGFVRLLFPQERSGPKNTFSMVFEELPSTFILDRGRICALRNRIRDLTYLDICCRSLHILEASTRAVLPRTDLANFAEDISASVKSVVDDGRVSLDKVDSDWWAKIEDIAALFVHRGGRNSLPTCFLDPTTAWLRNQLHPNSELFWSSTERLRTAITEHGIENFKKWLDLSPLQVHEAFVAYRHDPMPADRGECLESIRSLASHLAILHWQVWSPLLYTISNGGDNTLQSSVTGNGATDAFLEESLSRTANVSEIVDTACLQSRTDGESLAHSASDFRALEDSSQCKTADTCSEEIFPRTRSVSVISDVACPQTRLDCESSASHVSDYHAREKRNQR